jgi:DNA-binding NarL/FixJ family response regulator
MGDRTVVLVDDHQLIRAGIRMLLENFGDLKVIAEISLGKEAIERIVALKPDLVLLDISLPDISGLEVLATINAMDWLSGFPPRFVILSMHGQKEYLTRAFRAGAAGYLLKESAPEELESALLSVLAGQQWISPSLREHVAGRRIVRDEHPANGTLLSPRQKEVLTLIARGLSTKQIASELGLSAKTVETYRAQLMEKLDIKDIARLVIYAIRIGLIEV